MYEVPYADVGRKFYCCFLTIKIYIAEKVIQLLNYHCRFCTNVHFALSFPI